MWFFFLFLSQPKQKKWKFYRIFRNKLTQKKKKLFSKVIYIYGKINNSDSEWWNETAEQASTKKIETRKKEKEELRLIRNVDVKNDKHYSMPQKLVEEQRSVSFFVYV